MGTLTSSKSYNIERPSVLKLITDASSEPVSLSQMQEYLRFTASDQDDTINDCIAAARIEAESQMERAILSQTWDLILDEFPSYCQRTPDSEIIVPRSRLSSVTTLKYYDTDGTLQTWSSSNYRVDTDSEHGRITPAYGVSWPSARKMTGAIQIRFVAASWASAAATPRNVVMWIKWRAAQLFEFRGEEVSDRIGGTETMDHLLEPYKIRRFT